MVTLVPASNLSQLTHHPQHYYEDGTLVLRVENVLYRVHKYLFLTHSASFNDKVLVPADDIAAAGGCVTLPHVHVKDFDCLLSVLYPSSFLSPTLKTAEEWSSVLALATKWDFSTSGIRDLAIQNLSSLASDVVRISLGRTFGVDEWLESAYMTLCTSDAPFTDEEGIKLGLQNVLRVYDIRTWRTASAPSVLELVQKIQTTFSLYPKDSNEPSNSTIPDQPTQAPQPLNSVDSTKAFITTPPRPPTPLEDDLDSLLSFSDESTPSSPATNSSVFDDCDIAPLGTLDELGEAPSTPLEVVDMPIADMPLPMLQQEDIDPAPDSPAHREDNGVRLELHGSNILTPKDSLQLVVSLPSLDALSGIPPESRMSHTTSSNSTQSQSPSQAPAHPTPNLTSFEEVFHVPPPTLEPVQRISDLPSPQLVPADSHPAEALSSSPPSPNTSDMELPESLDCKVKYLLNKLTAENFDSISAQTLHWANKSEEESDGRSLKQVLRLIYEKAIDGEFHAEICARLCKSIAEDISPQIQDDGIKNPRGEPFAGDRLFRKYLLSLCQEDFERGWRAKETNPQKAKHLELGLVRFIGELFKLQLLTERVVRECVEKLLSHPDNPEEETEQLCLLLTIVGSVLDGNKKARAHMDICFSRIKGLMQKPSTTPPIRLMLQDVIRLRERQWIPRN